MSARHHAPCRHKFYRMTCAQFDEMFAAASGACQICGVAALDTPHGMLFIDHDYEIGPHGVRGLLCVRCNSALSYHRTKPLSEIETRYLESPWHLNFEPVPIRAIRRAGRTR